jgi:hypothetical protein
MEYYVYVYFFNGEPIYVGKGKNNRYIVHLKRCLNDNVKKTPFYDKLKYILNNGHKPEIKILFSNMTEDDALLKERELQIMYGSKLDNTGTLYNYIECGLKNPSLFGDKNPMKGKNIFQVWGEKYDKEVVNNKIIEYKRKMSQIVSGRTISVITKQKISKSKKQYWDNLDESIKDNFRKKISETHTEDRKKKSRKKMIEINKKMVGGNHPRSKKCLIDDKIFNSIKEVCLEYGFKNHNTVINRIKSNRYPKWVYYEQ